MNCKLSFQLRKSKWSVNALNEETIKLKLKTSELLLTLLLLKALKHINHAQSDVHEINIKIHI